MGRIVNIQSRTILIVEDSPVQVEVLRRTLEGAGHKVIAASNGAEGLAMAKANHPDAVVSDINMPVMDGYAMCHAIRDDAALKHTPVILLTMLSEPQDVIRGLNAGADAYVTKPYNVATLVSRLESLLAYPPVPPPPVERRKVEIRLAGEIHVVDAHGPRMLNLLVSTYENAVVQNRELLATQQALEDLNQHLEHKVLEKTTELRESEQRFRALIEYGSDLVVVLDAHGMITYVSPSVRRVGGYEPADLLRKNLTAFIHPDDVAAALADLSALVRNPGKLHAAQLRYRRKEGDWIFLESVAKSAIDDPAVAGVVINARDITERKLAEDQLRRLNRALTSIHACNEALVRFTDEAQLLDETCNLLVTEGGFRLVWVGQIEGPERRLRILAQAGREDGYIEAINPSVITPSGAGERLSDIAIRTGESVICNDIATDPAFQRWRKAALDRGYASMIVLPLLSEGKAFGVIDIYAVEAGAFDDAEVRLLRELAGDLAYGITARRTRVELDRAVLEREAQEHRLRRSLEDSIRAIAATVESRDPYTAGHQRRVAELATAIAVELGLPKDRIDGLRLGGIVHDLGKIHIPAEILSKPGRLSAIEFELIKSHPQAGYEILGGIEFPWPIAEMVLQHHERMDGTGYPQSFKGRAILLEARILAVADVMEAMSSHRPYRPGLGVDKALAEIERGRGTAYDMEVADACLKLFREKGYTIPA